MTCEEIRQAILEEYPGLVIHECKGLRIKDRVHLHVDLPRRGLKHARSIYGMGGMKEALIAIARQADVNLSHLKND